MIDLSNNSRLIAAILFGVFLIVGWFAYSPAFSGAFLLDDLSNLGQLQYVEDGAAALRFMFSGSAGPLGRPLALASFLPQAASWENGAGAFLRVNVAIHLFNAALLAMIFHRLSSIRGIEASKAVYIAVSAALVWLFMPLLASATLMVVQRMTTLSATFVLLGLLGYLLARGSIERSPNRSLLGMSMAVAVGTVLAAFTKESGALLPTYVLVLEATVLRRPAALTVARWRSWAGIFLVLPTAAIAVYLMSRVPYSEQLILRRDFSAWERLLTESRIMWEYLAKAFIPQAGGLGPFHDDYPVARSIFNPVTFLAFSGWLLIVTMAVLWRRKYPVAALGVLWFAAGHMVESTTIPLELYFEHRNYLPAAGAAYALCNIVFFVPLQYRKAVLVAIPLYILANIWFLVGVTSLWGNPALAAGYWHERFPASVRAATMYATHELSHGGPARTIQVLDDIASRNPRAAYVGIQALNLACLIAPNVDHERRAASLQTQLGNVDFSYTAGTMLSQLLTTVGRVNCSGIGVGDVSALAEALVENPRYSNDRAYRGLHHQLAARIYRESGAVEQTLEQLALAIELDHKPELNMMMVTTLVDDGQFDAARRYIQEAHGKGPVHPFNRRVWQQDLNELDEYVNAVEAHNAASADGAAAAGPDGSQP